MIFDTWGGALTPSGFRDFSLAYMSEIVQYLANSEHARDIPVTLFTKGAGSWLKDMALSGCTALGVDWTVDLGDARNMVNDQVALQGNMDPSMLYAPTKRIREQVGVILKSYGHGSGHIMNLGHGVQPTVDPDRVADFVNAVRELSPAYH